MQRSIPHIALIGIAHALIIYMTVTQLIPNNCLNVVITMAITLLIMSDWSLQCSTLKVINVYRSIIAALR